MKLKKKGLSGITLVELLIASLVATVIGAAIVIVFISGQNSFVVGTNLLEIHADARLAMEWIARDVQWTNQILANINIGGTTYTSGASEVVLSVPSVNAGDIVTGSFDSIVYTLNGTNLMRLVVPDAASSRLRSSDIIANNINNLQFGAGVDSIAVSLTAQKTVLGARVLSETLNLLIKMRNS